MEVKSKSIEYLFNAGIVFSGFYLIYGKNTKYISFPAFCGILASRYLGKIILISEVEEKGAGGTTPYNPLKIPAKKITPIH